MQRILSDTCILQSRSVQIFCQTQGLIQLLLLQHRKKYLPSEEQPIGHKPKFGLSNYRVSCFYFLLILLARNLSTCEVECICLDFAVDILRQRRSLTFSIAHPCLYPYYCREAFVRSGCFLLKPSLRYKTSNLSFGIDVL